MQAPVPVPVSLSNTSPSAALTGYPPRLRTSHTHTPKERRGAFVNGDARSCESVWGRGQGVDVDVDGIGAAARLSQEGGGRGGGRGVRLRRGYVDSGGCGLEDEDEDEDEEEDRMQVVADADKFNFMDREYLPPLGFHRSSNGFACAARPPYTPREAGGYEEEAVGVLCGCQLGAAAGRQEEAKTPHQTPYLESLSGLEGGNGGISLDLDGLCAMYVSSSASNLGGAWGVRSEQESVRVVSLPGNDLSLAVPPNLSTIHPALPFIPVLFARSRPARCAYHHRTLEERVVFFKTPLKPPSFTPPELPGASSLALVLGGSICTLPDPRSEGMREVKGAVLGQWDGGDGGGCFGEHLRLTGPTNHCIPFAQGLILASLAGHLPLLDC
ncbi:hypothetical protein R3P38DRAFT_3449595 [Favolaschia claudopus]|uniref:Uncharacterized protein n=1 Tax=Favolaschia claudopus TaxID=2862362 RepID=A0AAW0CT59_9AGAR